MAVIVSVSHVHHGVHMIEPRKDAPRTTHAKVQLLSDFGEVAPGGEVLLGVAFDIQPDWHIYWNGRNDSGTAPEIEWTLPDGWTVGPTRWPAPIRHVAAGDLVDHVYERNEVLLVPLKVPASTSSNVSHTVRAKVNYLVCNEACVPESAEVSVSLRVGEAKEPRRPVSPADRNQRIASAEKRVPVPYGSQVIGAELTWEGSKATIVVPGAARLEFYPSEDGAAISNLVKDGASNTNRIRLTLSDEDASLPLAGVLAVHFEGRPSMWFVIRVNRGAPLPGLERKEKSP